jgi:hypothetical protein
MIKEFQVTTNSDSWNKKTHQNLHVLQKVMFKYLTTCRFVDNTDVSEEPATSPFLQKVMFKYLTTCRFADNTDVSEEPATSPFLQKVMFKYLTTFRKVCYIVFNVISSEVKPEAQTVYSRPPFFKNTNVSSEKQVPVAAA